MIIYSSYLKQYNRLQIISIEKEYLIPWAKKQNKNKQTQEQKQNKATKIS